ncbi:RICIN domain-containing protein [Dactylosporangium sp. CS-047395]|uniref:RICIN domain-containing protein n=1 Tax=Dactylosporangium sp. CS-047395 TaxID=3239936 RepID=UPI003D92D07C
MRLIRMLLVALAAMAGTLVFTQTPALAATQGPYEIHPWGGIFWCAKVDNANQSAPVVIRNCGIASNFYQQWYWQDTTGGYYRIFNRQTGKCLNAAGNVTTGTRVIQYGCSTSALNDQWKPTIKQNGDIDYYWLQNRQGGLCLRVNTSSSGNQLFTGACNQATWDDRWTWDSH